MTLCPPAPTLLYMSLLPAHNHQYAWRVWGLASFLPLLHCGDICDACMLAECAVWGSPAVEVTFSLQPTYQEFWGFLCL